MTTAWETVDSSLSSTGGHAVEMERSTLARSVSLPGV